MSSSRSSVGVLAFVAIVFLPALLAADPVVVSPPYLFGEEPPTPVRLPPPSQLRRPMTLSTAFHV